MADDKIVIGKDTFYGIVIVVLVGLLVLSIFTQGFGIIKTQSEEQITNDQVNDITGFSVNFGSLPALGKESAQVAVVEFSDYQCPFCSQLYLGAEAGIKKNYVNSGKVKIYFRDFPLSFHPNAMPGAIAARCANDQDKFWEMHDKLFDNQNTWSVMADPTQTLEGYATGLGLDSAKFKSCYENQNHLAEINADEAEGQTYGVQGTPGSYIIVPKEKIGATVIQSAVASSGGALTLYENDKQYIVFVAGAYPYTTFDLVLSKISY